MSNSDQSDHDDNLLLPNLGDGDDFDHGIDSSDEDAHINVDIVDDHAADPFDDEVASDLPIDIVLTTTDHEPSAIGDDAKGVEGVGASDGVALEESGQSFLGPEQQGLEFEGDESMGLDPIPLEVDDGGLEGLEDPSAERISADSFPPLDGDDSDEEAPELELNLDLSTPSREESGLDDESP